MGYPVQSACGGLVAVLVLSVALISPASAAPEKAPPHPDPNRQVIEALAQTQATLQQQLGELRETVNKLGEKVQTIADSLDQQRQTLDDTQKADKTSHDDLDQLSRGLYVEVNGVKGDVALAREDVQGLKASGESSRLGIGILIAAVIALQIILVLLAIRGRG